jgi:hypothetical protein
LKKFFVLPRLPSNEKNSSDHHNSYNKGPNLAFFSFTDNPSNSIPTIKFPKNHTTSSYHSNMPEIAKAKIWPLGTLGVKKPTLIGSFLSAGSKKPWCSGGRGEKAMGATSIMAISV